MQVMGKASVVAQSSRPSDRMVVVRQLLQQQEQEQEVQAVQEQEERGREELRQ